MHEHGPMVMVRKKRDWCPEWLWWFACNPIPFWNDTIAIAYPFTRVWIGPLTHVLSYSVEDDEVPE